jgi:hypothetical protein
MPTSIAPAASDLSPGRGERDLILRHRQRKRGSKITRHASQQLSPSNERMTMSNPDSAYRKRLRGGCLGGFGFVMRHPPLPVIPM